MAPNTHHLNEDELSAPAWMNNEFFEKVLKHCENSEDVKLKGLKMTPATAKGDHYASVMFRATVVYSLQNEDKTKSMIIKTSPEHESNKTEMFKESQNFETEIGMYTEIIPKFEAILKAAGDDTKLGASCLYHSLAPKKLIIFEDIVPLGYEVMRNRTLNLLEAKATYAKIAKWHAISYKMNLENPHAFDEYNNGMFMQSGMLKAQAFHDSITNFIELLNTHEDLKQYKSYFEPLVGKIVDECVKTFTEARKNKQADGLYVLCHGDFHYKNIMLKHEPTTGQFLDTMLLDFQMCYFGPMVNDIIYSIYLLLDQDLRANHLDKILHFYFTTFQDTLRKIGFERKIPKMLQFRELLMRHKNFELFILTTFLPLFTMFFEGVVDGDEIHNNPQIRKKAFHDPKYVSEVRKLLPKLLHMGYLEDL